MRSPSGLHTLGDHRDIESLAEAYHGAHPRLGLAVMIDTRDERPIDLDLVEGERLQRRQQVPVSAESTGL
jgi:hypothetical protein